MSEDPLADLKSHHPQIIDLSRLPDRAVTSDERNTLIQGARSATTLKEWGSFVAGFVGKAIGGAL